MLVCYKNYLDLFLKSVESLKNCLKTGIGKEADHFAALAAKHRQEGDYANCGDLHIIA